MDLLIETVNEADLGWTADVCKYQKHHAKYGSHCEKEALLLAQTGDDDLTEIAEDATKSDSSTAGKFGDKNDPKFMAALAKAQKYIKQY